MSIISRIGRARDAVPDALKVAVVIPCYKVRKHILGVIERIGPEVAAIFVIDDACPEKSGAYVREHCRDPRVVVLTHDVNQGVGGAVMTGYRAAIADDADIIVKIDGDGQMDPALVSDFVEPIWEGEADYAKGNRFFNLEETRAMPTLRLFGNAVLSLISKLSTGYWRSFDPTNGYTAIHARVAAHLPLEKISRRYFFETDILFRLNTLRAVVVDVPMAACYGDEVSNIKIPNIIGEFLFKNLRNMAKRIFYNYYLRDMSLASIELPLGIVLLVWGFVYGVYHWNIAALSGTVTPAGTVIAAALPILLGVQFLMAFLAYDINNVPSRPVHKTRHFYKREAQEETQEIRRAQ